MLCDVNNSLQINAGKPQNNWCLKITKNKSDTQKKQTWEDCIKALHVIDSLSKVTY